MAKKELDLRGLPCPQPTLRLTMESNNLKAGDTIEAVADCQTFVDDVRSWCIRMDKDLVWFKEEGVDKRVLVKV